VQLVLGDSGVANDGREVGVAEVGGNEAGIAPLLAQAGDGGVAERVSPDALLEARSVGVAANDSDKDRRLEPLAFEPAEHRRVGARVAVCPTGWRIRLQAEGRAAARGLPTLPHRTSSDGGSSSRLEVGPVKRNQLSAPQLLLDKV